MNQKRKVKTWKMKNRHKQPIFSVHWGHRWNLTGSVPFSSVLNYPEKEVNEEMIMFSVDENLDTATKNK